jgi:hypothetical protein
MGNPIESRGPLFEEFPKGKEAPGLEGEEIFGEFLTKIFPCISKVEKTSQRDQNDRNGVDFVWTIKTKDKAGKDTESQIAVDVTGAKDERRELKVDRLRYNSLVVLHDENRKAISEPMPRLLLSYNISLFRFAGHNLEKHKAEKKSASLLGEFGDEELKKQREEILKQIREQIKFLSAKDSHYGEKAIPISRAFAEDAKRELIAA